MGLKIVHIDKLFVNERSTDANVPKTTLINNRNDWKCYNIVTSSVAYAIIEDLLESVLMGILVRISADNLHVVKLLIEN